MPAWSTGVAAFSLCYAGLTGLCLAMGKHYQQVWQRQTSANRSKVLRVAGWLSLALSVCCCVLGWGASVGLVIWCGVVSAAAVLIAMILPYAPRVVAAFAMASGVIGLGTMIAAIS